MYCVICIKKRLEKVCFHLAYLQSKYQKLSKSLTFFSLSYKQGRKNGSSALLIQFLLSPQLISIRLLLGLTCFANSRTFEILTVRARYITFRLPSCTQPKTKPKCLPCVFSGNPLLVHSTPKRQTGQKRNGQKFYGVFAPYKTFSLSLWYRNTIHLSLNGLDWWNNFISEQKIWTEKNLQFNV